jgi:hypothetical protein
MQQKVVSLVIERGLEMGKFELHKAVSCFLVIFFPVSMFAADSGAAMLYSNGAAWLNGSNVARSSAVFSGDLIQTRSDFVANVNAPGSSVTVLSDSLVQFEGSGWKIEHGGLAVSTSKRIAATAGGVKVAPASDSWTEFDVTDVDGTVRIAARKGDLAITDGHGTVTLMQGQETTRDESADQTDKNKKRKRDAGAVPASVGGMLNSPVAIGIGFAAIAGVTAWVLLQSDKPASPSAP